MIGATRYLLAGLLLGSSLFGCDSNTQGVAVTGEVYLDERPLPQGLIRFVPVGNAKANETVVFTDIVDGRFELAESQGPSVGIYKIEIRSTDTAGFALDDEDAMRQIAKLRRKTFNVVTIPSRYNKSSVLREQLTEGVNQLRFDLTSSTR